MLRPINQHLGAAKACIISPYPSMKKVRLNNAPVILYYQIGCVEHVLQHIVGASTADETRCLTHAGSFVFQSFSLSLYAILSPVIVLLAA